MPDVAVKVVVTPLLIVAASLAGRRWGHQIGGWLVGLPLTSGPVAFFLFTDQGATFAAQAAVGMLAGTTSQLAFAVAYRRTIARTGRRWVPPLLAGCVGFAAATVGLSWLHWPILPTFGLVTASLVAGRWLLHRPAGTRPAAGTGPAPRWDLPARAVVATGLVLALTAMAPLIGSHLAGLLSPLPVFGGVLVVFTHRRSGPSAATAVLDGLVVGWFAPAVFFAALALALPRLGVVAFGVATAAALVAQGCALLAIPRATVVRVSRRG